MNNSRYIHDVLHNWIVMFNIVLIISYQYLIETITENIIIE